MGYYDALVAKWSSVPGATLDEKIDAINALTVPGPARDVPVSDVRGYLLRKGIEFRLNRYANNPSSEESAAAVAYSLVRMTTDPNATSFAMTDPQIAGEMAASLQTLLAAGLISADDKTALGAMAQTTLPWWQAPIELGGGGLSSPINAHDLVAAEIVSQEDISHHLTPPEEV